MNVTKFGIAVLVALSLAGCANRSVKDVSVGDSGQSYKVKFGTVIAQTNVNVRSSDESAVAGGALAGGAAGALIGRSSGAGLAGLVIGGLAGAAVHHAAETGNAIQYTIAFADGSTQVINQIQAPEDPVFRPGHSVMVQFGANRNLVLDASQLPSNVRRPKQVVVEGGRPQNGTIGVRTCQSAAVGESGRTSCTDN